METKNLEVQSILLTKIRPNPDNPRHVITQKMVDTLAASMKTAGLKNPVKVQRISEKPEIATPQDTPTGSTGSPQVGAAPSGFAKATPDKRNDDYEYELISGHVRLAAAEKLGWEDIPAFVLDLTPKQALLEAILDNRGQQMTWLDLYQSIEQMLQIEPKPTQQLVADQLEVDQATVSRGLKLMRLLTPTSRDLIYENFIKPNGYELPEIVVRRLTDLEDPSKSLEENQNLVERALKVVIDHEMTEPEAKELVFWVKSGHDPETFPLRQGSGGQVGEKPEIATAQDAPTGSTSSPQVGAGPRNDSEDPYSAYWQGLPDKVKVTRGKKGYRVVMDLFPSEAVPVVYGAMSNWEYLKGQSGEAEDLRYRNALPQVHKDAVKARTQEMQLGVRNEELGISKPKKQKEGAKAKKPLGVNDQSQPVEKGFLGKFGDVIQQKTGLTPQDLKDGVKTMLAKDAKQAANYEVRRKMRNFFKDLF